MSTWAGTTARAIVVDGPQGTLGGPFQLAPTFDGSGVLFTDPGSRRVRRLDLATGVVTTLAGSGLLGPLEDGPATGVGLASPAGVVDAGKVVLFSDAAQQVVRFSFEQVQIFSGSGQFGVVDGPSGAARFASPGDLAMTNESVWVIDQDGHTLRAIDFSGNAVTVAGAPFEAGFADGVGAAARFSNPTGLAVLPAVGPGSDVLVVADQGNNVVRGVDTSTGEVFLIAGVPGGFGARNGTADLATFNGVADVAVADDGSIFVADRFNQLIRRIVAPRRSSSTPLAQTTVETRSFSITPNQPVGVAVIGTDVFVAESFGGRILKDPAAGATTAVAGTGVIDIGLGPAATFVALGMGTPDGEGGFFFTDRLACRLLQARPSPAAGGLLIDAVAGTGRCGIGAGELERPHGVVRHPDFPEHLFVAAQGSFTIARVTVSTGEVAHVAGGPRQFGDVDGVGTTARFQGPSGLAYDPVRDVILIADENTASIRTFDPTTGVVGTLAGGNGFGHLDGAGGVARFGSIQDVAVDADGIAWVVDPSFCALRRIDADGVVTTAFGGPGRCGLADGDGDAARVEQVFSVDVLGDGRLVITDAFSSRVVVWDPSSSTLTTVVGNDFDEVDGPLSQARVRIPREAFQLPTGEVVVFDRESSRIRAIGGL